MCMLANALTENFSFIQILTAGSTCVSNVKLNTETYWYSRSHSSDGTYCHQINLNSKAWPIESVFPISSIQEYAWKNIYPKIMPSSIFDGKIKLKIATLWVTKENRQTHIPCWEFGLFVLFVHETLVYLYSQRQPVLLVAGRGCTGMQTCKETEYTALNNIYTTTKIRITKSWELWVYCTDRKGSGFEIYDLLLS